MPENAKHVQGYKVIHPPAHSVNLFLPSDLSKNQISDIAADAFSGLRSLTSL